jgi:predicted nucleic acid-binding protein
MILVDTSVWVEVLRDRTGRWRESLENALDGDDAVLTRFHQLELLQGARDEREWNLLQEHLDVQDYLECGPESWPAAARIFFELRRIGKTVRSPIDCASHRSPWNTTSCSCDRDFETIATVRPLRRQRLA